MPKIHPGAAQLHVMIAELVAEALDDPDGGPANDLRLIGILPGRASAVPRVSAPEELVARILTHQAEALAETIDLISPWLEPESADAIARKMNDLFDAIDRAQIDQLS